MVDTPSWGKLGRSEVKSTWYMLRFSKNSSFLSHRRDFFVGSKFFDRIPFLQMVM